MYGNTYTKQMLEAIKKIKERGLTKEETKEVLYKAGITDENGNIVEEYKNIISLKKDSI